MKQPRDTFPQAIVPEHLSKLTIEKLPLDRIYYVAPGERDDYESPVIFQSPDKRLLMSKSHAIDMADEYPASPVSMVGIMRTYIIDETTDSVREHYVADLRFIGDYDLVDTENIAADSDQEEYMAWMSQIENSITFSAFIAAEQHTEVQENGKVRGAFYGNPQLYDVLEKMNKRGNKLMKKFLCRLNSSEKLAKAAANSTIKTAINSEQSDNKSSAKNLSVEFRAP